MIGIMIPSAFAQSMSTLVLDPIPSSVQSGDEIIFSGVFYTNDGYLIQDATIIIKDDVSFGADYIIGTVVTDENGEFYGTWNAEMRAGGGSYDFYAVFEGSSNIAYTRSQTYSVDVRGDPTSSQTPFEQQYGQSAGLAPTTLRLDQIPSAVRSGDSVTFTGQLTSNGQAISGALVYIYEDDPFKADQQIGFALTNSRGEFSIPWKVTAGLVEIDFDIYATFNGDTSFEYARTSNQEMSVTKYQTSISLDTFPQQAQIGETIIFSGQVQLERGSPEGFVVYIKDEDMYNADDLLATAYVNGDGKFRANWSVSDVDADGIVDVYAVLEAKETYYRSTTCDTSGITFDFGGDCSNLFPIQITGTITETEIIYEESPSTYNFSGDEYMKLYYALNFQKPPVIAIIADPDSYEKVRPYLIPTQEGVLTWADLLEKNYPDGNWNVEFDVIVPGEQFPRKPDILINVVYNDNWCDEFGGVAFTTGIKPVNSLVCTKYGSGDMRSTSSVAGTAGHEFAHTVGSGHAFNKLGDRMCSTENGKPTCPIGGIRDIVKAIRFSSDTPSNFDLAAIASLYGEDGWQNPNRYDITRNTKLTAEEFLSGQIDKGVSTTTKDEPEVTIERLSSLYSSNRINVYGGLSDCGSWYGDTISIKILNPSGKQVYSEPMSLYGTYCSFDTKISVNEHDLVQGKWKVIAEYNGNQKQSSFDIFSFQIPDSKDEPRNDVTREETSEAKTRNDVTREETSEAKTRNDVTREETSEAKTRNDVTREETSEAKPPVYEVEREKSEDVIENVTSLKIKSDKEYYVVGDKVWINGVALSATSNVNLKIVDPEGNLVKMFQSNVMRGNVFDATFEIEKQFFPLAGGYDIIAWQSSASEDMDVITIKIGIKGVDNIKKLGVPTWIKNNAGWWAEGQIDDNSFVQGIQFMIKENIISIPNLPESSSETADSVPAWVKNNAGWWAEGQIDDSAFVQGIEYLVKVGIIQVS